MRRSKEFIGNGRKELVYDTDLQKLAERYVNNCTWNENLMPQPDELSGLTFYEHENVNVLFVRMHTIPDLANVFRGLIASGGDGFNYPQN